MEDRSCWKRLEKRLLPDVPLLRKSAPGLPGWAGVALLAAFCLAPKAAGSQTPAYDQPFRPQVHFSPLRNWTNDPNGLVFYRGQYHLFFQYNPQGDQWGHMSWGHAVSPDLLHWRQLPVAIPESNGVMIFTGSVVVDHGNTSGLCGDRAECLVAVYTGASEHRQTQNLAYSRDGGMTWTKYEKNPVLDLHMADFRDPSVSWDESAHRWIMAVSLPKEHKVSFYASTDLKSWDHLSDFGPAGATAGDWECPDLVRVPDASGRGGMWALKVGLNPGAPQGGSGEQYFLGNFDGTSFRASSDPGAHGWTNYGKDDYCAISFNGLPPGKRPVLLGWMSNWQYAAKLPTSPWRGQMSLPRRLSLLRDAAGLALRQEPVIEKLRGKSLPLADIVSARGGQPIKAPFELDLAFARSAGGRMGIRLYSDDEHWTEIAFDTDKREFSVDRTHAGLDIGPGFAVRTVAPIQMGRRFDVRLIVDRSSLEAFAQDGTIAMTDLIFPPSARNTIRSFSSHRGEVKVSGEAWELRSIWAARTDTP
jgi:fructan beta-fructosidase